MGSLKIWCIVGIIFTGLLSPSAQASIIDKEENDTIIRKNLLQKKTEPEEHISIFIDKEQGSPIIYTPVSNPNIETIMSLAELQEILSNIHEDFERVQLLNRPDKEDILTILKAKKEAIIQLIKNLDGFDANTLELYLEYSRKNEETVGDTVLWSIIGLCTVSATALTLIASYDIHCGFKRPSSECLKNNIHTIGDMLSTYLARLKSLCLSTFST